ARFCALGSRGAGDQRSGRGGAGTGPGRRGRGAVSKEPRLREGRGGSGCRAGWGAECWRSAPGRALGSGAGRESVGSWQEGQGGEWGGGCGGVGLEGLVWRWVEEGVCGLVGCAGGGEGGGTGGGGAGERGGEAAGGAGGGLGAVGAEGGSEAEPGGLEGDVE